MMKAKAKADKAAERAARVPGIADGTASTSNVPSRAETPIEDATSSAETPSTEPTNEPDAPVIPVLPLKEGMVDRSELLRCKSEVVNHFMNLMTPILVDVYAASVSVPVRIKSLTGLLKAICFLESEQLVRIFKV